MKYFVEEDSIVRKIWGKADTVLFIFAGAAAEFALNKAVDWLYFTGRLPADPLGRLFSTVTYAKQIIFAEEEAAIKAIDQITAIHKGIEKSRGAQIPDWAYRDVLFLLIDYSIRSFEVLDRELTEPEKHEVFDVFYRVGLQMGLTGLPGNYNEWVIIRETHLHQNLAYSNFTADLYLQYKKHLGAVRFALLVQVQLMLVPKIVSNLLFPGKESRIKLLLQFYKFSRYLKLQGLLKNALLPAKYKAQIMALNR